MMLATSVFIWLALWALIVLGRSIVHATRNKVYNLEDTKAFKAAKARWDRIK